MYGEGWRNRKRFLMEVAEQIRYACPGICLGVRLSAEEHMEGGLDPDEASLEELLQKNNDAAFYSGKLASARFFANENLMMSPIKARVILRADRMALEITDRSF